MFHSTRLKLTAWYLLIIIFVSLVFSIVIYFSFNRELVRFEHFQTIRQQRMREEFGELPVPPVNIAVDQQLITEARGRMITNILLLNICIIAGSGVAGYFLAGRTLTPIKRMIDEQARFVGDASHELKTPLTALRSEIEVYLRSKKPTLSEARQILKSNLEEVIKLQSLSDNLMELALAEKFSSQIVFEKVRFHAIFESAMKSVGPLAKAKKIEIVNRSGKLLLLGDENTLIQLFTILLDNAIKYSNPKTTVTIASSVAAQVATIKVSDHGIGIASNEISHIFDRFYRVSKSRNSQDVPGYGLGLAIAKEIVKLHDGTITVKSSAEGSIFAVTLPVATRK